MAIEEGESSEARRAREEKEKQQNDLEQRQKEEAQEDAAAARTEVCPDCNEKHGRRRLIICHDAVGLLPDSAIEDPRGNTTNIMRIWSMIKEGAVIDPNTEQEYEQIRAPFIEGIQAVENVIERFLPGLVGDGASAYELAVKEVYKKCCRMCASRDEIFMFGFSRGAYILRSVTGLLHHLRALKPELVDFDVQFLKAFRIYREAQTEAMLQESKSFLEISQNAKRPAKVQFLGCFDTIKAVDDVYANLHDVGNLETVQHVRHALALFERRDVMRAVRLQVANPEQRFTSLRSFQEAWFSGTHGNLGGGQPEDGLALWPLQWIVGEAQKQGLVLEWKQPKGMKMDDPTNSIFPKEVAGPQTFICQNGITVDMWDIRSVLEQKGRYPMIDVGKLKLALKTDRLIFRYGDLMGRRVDDSNGAFVHPSVFLLDQTDTRTILAIDAFEFADNLRAQASFTIPDKKLIFWNLHRRIALKRQTLKSRIVVCGPDDSIKLSLINSAFGQEVTADSGVTDIANGFMVEGKNFVIHIAPSFQTAQPADYEKLHDFVAEQRQQPIFAQQIHCIWYCTSEGYDKLQPCDQKFREIEFGGIPIIHVSIVDDPFSWGVKDLSVDDQSQNPARISEWDQEMGIFSSSMSLGTNIEPLITASQKCLTDPRILRIHNQAQSVFVNSKLQTSVGQVVPMYLKARPQVYNLAKNVQLDKLIQASISTIAETFSNKNHFDPQNHVTTMRNLIYPPPPDESLADTLVGWLAPGLARSAGGVLASGLFGPIGAVMFASSTLMGKVIETVNDTQKIHLLMLIACIDVLLVIERLFFYTKGAKIDPDGLSIRAACVDYLHLKPKVVQKLSEIWRSDGFSDQDWPDEEMLKNILQEVVNSFRVKRVTE